MLMSKDILLYLLRVSALCAVAVFATDVETHGCVIQFPDSKHKISINTDYDFQMRFDETIDEHIRINLCGDLVKKCAGVSKGYAACFSRNGEEFGVGKFPPNISLNNSNAVFSYIGDKCNKTHDFTVRLELVCDLYQENTFYIKENRYVPGDCEFDITVNTNLACGNKEHYICDLDYIDGHSYNLNHLRNSNNDYVVEINSTLSIVLNVCRSLVFSVPQANCGSNSAICLIDQSHYAKVRYVNLGNIDGKDGISFTDDGVLKIIYEKGDVCVTDKTKRFRSTIKFVCDMNAKEGYVEYVGGLESCDLLLVWRTAASCSEEDLVKSSLDNQQSCAIIDPVNGYIYDLYAMREENMSVFNTNHDEYRFSVCREIENSQCGKGSGVCKISNDTGYKELGGIANSQLLWSPKIGLYLNYSDGDACRRRLNRYSIIKVQCDRAQFFDVSENYCSTSITFLTNLACPHICWSYYHAEFDSLMKSTLGLEIQRNDTIYSFNACGTLHPPKRHLDCMDGGSGICKSTRNKFGKRVETSLGYPVPLPRVIDRGITALHYDSGSPCEDDAGVPISSRIHLICDSYPDLVTYKNCIYYFKWRSQQSCGIVDCKMNTDCSVENDLGHLWDLKYLPMTTIIRSALYNEHNSHYKINICGPNNVMNTSSISTNARKFGKLTKVTIDYTKKTTLNLYFEHGTPCASGFSHTRAVLHLVCDDTYKPNDLVLLWEEECSVAFEWRTPHICSPEWIDSKSSQSSESFWSIGVIVFMSIIITLVVISMVFGICWIVKRNRRRQQNQRPVRYSKVEDTVGVS